MSDYKRSLKNLLINSEFQFQFMLRIFVFTFAVLMIGGAVQYFVSNMTILQKIDLMSEKIDSRQQELIDALDGVTPEKGESENVASLHHAMLADEVRFHKTLLNDLDSVLANNLQDLRSRYWYTLILVGIFINIVFAFLYGIIISHKFAGNHFRIQKFAKQLQNRDLATPLSIRKTDFFQETAMELEQARGILQGDLRELQARGDGKIEELLSSYKL